MTDRLADRCQFPGCAEDATCAYLHYWNQNEGDDMGTFKEKLIPMCKAHAEEMQRGGS